jgi:hypothetical protein
LIKPGIDDPGLHLCVIYSDVVEAERQLAGMCSNWQQFHLLTRPREQHRDLDQEPTRQTILPILASSELLQLIQHVMDMFQIMLMRELFSSLIFKISPNIDM